MRKHHPVPNPTDGELAILRVLWAHRGPMTVREVHDVLVRSKDTAYTTVLKMLTIMADKGLVRRDESQRSHRYQALQEEPTVQASLLKELTRKAFSGSALMLVQRALADDVASEAELGQIAKLIDEAKARRRDGGN
ncbi:MAG: BlaI/MecI/CopY family transcriptional regulator [Proteobacteria bacterium]|nr:BlaI/MecI/CopY family transcriptional regulator [Pseudomonadota bacterium]